MMSSVVIFGYEVVAGSYFLKLILELVIVLVDVFALVAPTL